MGRASRNSLRLQQGKLRLDIRKKFFIKSGQALKQAANREEIGSLYPEKVLERCVNVAFADMI